MIHVATLDAANIGLISGATVTIIGVLTSAVVSIINLIARTRADARQQEFNLDLKRQAELDRRAAEQRNEQVKKTVVDVAAAQDKLAVDTAEEVKHVAAGQAADVKKELKDRAVVIKDAVDLVNGGVEKMGEKFSKLQEQNEQLKAELFRLRNAET